MCPIKAPLDQFKYLSPPGSVRTKLHSLNQSLRWRACPHPLPPVLRSFAQLQFPRTSEKSNIMTENWSLEIRIPKRRIRWWGMFLSHKTSEMDRQNQETYQAPKYTLKERSHRSVNLKERYAGQTLEDSSWRYLPCSLCVRGDDSKSRSVAHATSSAPTATVFRLTRIRATAGLLSLHQRKALPPPAVTSRS